MKSYNHLFEELISRKNILRAIFNSSKRKRKRKDVSYILEHQDETVLKVQNLFKNGFPPQIHKATEIYDKSGHKTRHIVKPYYCKNYEGREVFEQIVHHAVIQVLQPIFMHGMYEFSCGSIPGRGGHYGKKYLEKYIRENPGTKIKYCCKFDIRHFYESINTEILKNKFRKVIHDEKMLNILFSIIDSNEVIYKNEITKKGLLIGFYPSQWFANWFLQDFDHYVKEVLKIKCYVRYVDDIVILSPNKRDLRRQFEQIREYLAGIDLQIKDNYQIFKFVYEKNGKTYGRPIDFMGFKFYRNRTTLRKSIVNSSTKKARKVCKKEKITHYDASQILSYTGWYKCTDTYKFFQTNIANRVNLGTCKDLISRHTKKEKGEQNAFRLQNRGI